MQSIRGAIDIGFSGGLKFGYGEKKLTGYRFRTAKVLAAEKSKYPTNPTNNKRQNA